MKSDKVLSASTERRVSRSAMEAVWISNSLIALYPQPLRHPQPYVILLDPSSGILKRVDLRATR